VLHGDQMVFRQVVTKLLLESKGPKLAFRYAACGLDDQVVHSPDGIRVQPRGCGHRLCPRCGRRRGGKYARRIMGWLGHEPHGDLWSVVLTQRVVRGESLADARKRMAKKQRAYLRWLTRVGMTAGMTVVHVVWSKGREGWHYHVHTLAELPAGRFTAEQLLAKWTETALPEEVVTGEEQARLVVGGGAAIAELRDDAGDTDFWNESTSAVAKAVQYPMRDLAQGLSSWRLGSDPERVLAAAREVLLSAHGWKLFRAWGRWRHACPAAVAAEAVEKPDDSETESDGSAAPAAPEAIGTVHRLWKRARQGEEFARSVFRGLEPTVRNASDFAARFVKYCRLASTGPPS